MASLDVKPLFTNPPLEETKNNSCDTLFANETKKIISVERILKNVCERLYKTTSSILTVKSINKLME